MSPIEFVPLVVVAVLFWFFLIRPQSKRARELRELQRSLEVGDEVVLTSGIYGTVRRVADDHVLVELTEGVTVKVARAAVGLLAQPSGYTGPDVEQSPDQGPEPRPEQRPEPSPEEKN